MRRSPRPLILALAALALAAAGCGGSEVDADEVPAGPPALVVPSDSELAADSGSGADETTDGTTDETTDPDAADQDSTGDGTAAPAEPVEPSGGTTAPDAAAPEDTTADPAQPEPGSAPEQFESFCEQNAGAC
jgi:hypothetical protein